MPGGDGDAVQKGRRAGGLLVHDPLEDKGDIHAKVPRSPLRSSRLPTACASWQEVLRRTCRTAPGGNPLRQQPGIRETLAESIESFPPQAPVVRRVRTERTVRCRDGSRSHYAPPR